MWVRSEYTSELAVLAAWVSLLVPWSVAYNGDAPVFGLDNVDATLYFVRFPLFELQFRSDSVIQNQVEFDIAGLLASQYPGTELFASIYVTTPPTSALFYDGRLALASVVWSVAALAFLCAFGLSIALYLREDAVVARLPVSEVRLMGALLGVGALGAAAASVLHYTQRAVVGTPIPIGVLVIAAFALVLLRIETVEGEDGESPQSDAQ